MQGLYAWCGARVRRRQDEPKNGAVRGRGGARSGSEGGNLTRGLLPTVRFPLALLARAGWPPDHTYVYLTTHHHHACIHRLICLVTVIDASLWF